ncbi:MAG: hypothetical protein Q4G08_01965 [Capnocytophaga sp.]|nr:hypothetical protein [Capnocytophaga sp.]
MNISRLFFHWAALFYVCVMPVSVSGQTMGKEAQSVMNKLEEITFSGKAHEALTLLEKAVNEDYTDFEKAFFYAHRSGFLVAIDSLVASKASADQSLYYAEKSGADQAKAVALRAQAFLALILNEPDQAMDFAQQGVAILNDTPDKNYTLYSLNYIIYSIYSKWKNADKMETYIRKCEQNVLPANNANRLANVYNGLSSTLLYKYQQLSDKTYADSSMTYSHKAFELYNHHPEKVSVNTFVITCINIANFYLEHATEPLPIRQREAFRYLALAEKELTSKQIESNKWLNIYGIKSSFALQESNLTQAEAYLMQGLFHIQKAAAPDLNAEYTFFTQLADIASQKGDYKAAFEYQRRAETILRNIFNQRQLFNIQKLEIQYETQKKNQELYLLNQQKESERQQKFLYLGIAAASVLGLGSMFRAYHLRIRLEKEKETMWELEKQEAETQMKFEKEEQARLKAEQALLELQQEQLRKEMLASNLIIDRKNDMLRRIQDKINEGASQEVRNMLKNHVVINSDFEEVKSHINQLHPTFFKQLEEYANQKLTYLDKKYCSYIYLNMNNKQIAQALHVGTQTVRTFKYRLKQKFDVDKGVDLESFIQKIS